MNNQEYLILWKTIIYKFLVSSDSSISDETKQKYINKIFTNPKISTNISNLFIKNDYLKNLIDESNLYGLLKVNNNISHTFVFKYFSKELIIKSILIALKKNIEIKKNYINFLFEYLGEKIINELSLQQILNLIQNYSLPVQYIDILFNKLQQFIKLDFNDELNDFCEINESCFDVLDDNFDLSEYYDITNFNFNNFDKNKSLILLVLLSQEELNVEQKQIIENLFAIYLKIFLTISIENIIQEKQNFDKELKHDIDTIKLMAKQYISTNIHIKLLKKFFNFIKNYDSMLITEMKEIIDNLITNTSIDYNNDYYLKYIFFEFQILFKINWFHNLKYQLYEDIEELIYEFDEWFLELFPLLEPNLLVKTLDFLIKEENEEIIFKIMSYINQNYKLFEQHKRELFVILNDNYFFEIHRNMEIKFKFSQVYIELFLNLDFDLEQLNVNFLVMRILNPIWNYIKNKKHINLGLNMYYILINKNFVKPIDLIEKYKLYEFVFTTKLIKEFKYEIIQKWIIDFFEKVNKNIILTSNEKMIEKNKMLGYILFNKDTPLKYLYYIVPKFVGNEYLKKRLLNNRNLPFVFLRYHILQANNLEYILDNIKIYELFVTSKEKE